MKIRSLSISLCVLWLSGLLSGVALAEKKALEQLDPPRQPSVGATAPPQPVKPRYRKTLPAPQPGVYQQNAPAPKRNRPTFKKSESAGRLIATLARSSRPTG